jgi:hypothetical protein
MDTGNAEAVCLSKAKLETNLNHSALTPRKTKGSPSVLLEGLCSQLEE